MFNVQANINNALEYLLTNSYELKAVENTIGYIKAELAINHAKLSSYKLAVALSKYADALKHGRFRAVRHYLATIKYHYDGYMVDRKYEPLVA